MLDRILAAIALLFALVCAAQATEALPKRKSGLWEIESKMQGMPSMAGPIQMCTDQKTDDILRQGADEMKPKCSVMDSKKEGDRVTVTSVCKIMDQTTATTTAVFTGSFESSYRGEINSVYDPPLQGRKDMNITLLAKWLGPCKEGQKPGDVTLPNLGPLKGKIPPNVQELMKMRQQMK